MQQQYYPLAIIHEGHRLCLAKLIITQHYEEIGSIITKLQTNESINLGGPMWFLQLWANAIFEPFLRPFPPIDLPRGLDGPRPCYLNRDVPKTTPVVDEFYFFFQHLHQLSFSNTRGMNLSPYSDQIVDPSWFVRSKIDLDPNVQQELNELWSNLLCYQVLPTSLLDSKNRNIKLHNPSVLARQFGFSQRLCTILTWSKDPTMCIIDQIIFWPQIFFEWKWREMTFALSHTFQKYLFSYSFIYWLVDEYYKPQYEKISIFRDILIANLPNPSLQKGDSFVKDKKYTCSKNPSIWKVFQVRYNPRAISRVVQDAMDVFKWKKEQYEGWCWCAFEKVKSFNPFIRHQSYMTPFLFPYLPNALLGIADHFPDTSQGPLRTLYLHPRHKVITFIGLFLLKETKHLIHSWTRVLEVPLISSLLTYYLTILLNSYLINL